MKVLIDNGHGSDTPGKRSPIWPDGSQLREYAYAREIAAMLEAKLNAEGIPAIRITPETTDIALGIRTKRVNDYCAKYGSQNCLVVSIHNNASGNGYPETARGWCVYVSENAGKSSKKLANDFCDAANNNHLKVRINSPQQRFWVGNLAICRDTKCPAVLTENLFMDNADDCRFLLSKVGKETIVQIHVDAIKNYIHAIQTGKE